MYDARALATLATAVKPECHTEPRRDAPLFAKGSDRRRVLSEAQRVAELWKQENARRPVDAVLVHEDTDDVEPSHVALAEQIERALDRVGCPGVAVVCAWEIEAWFFLWPDAIEATRTAWVVPAALRGRATGLIQDPKRALRTQCLRAGAKARLRYQEKDAPDIAEQIVGQFASKSGSSGSFDRFVSKLANLGRA
jgi:hypothetical protein